MDCYYLSMYVPVLAGSCFPDTDSWLFFDEKCWFISPLNPEAVRSVVTWHDAASFCKTYNGYLASIHNPDQNAFLRGQVHIKYSYIHLFKICIGHVKDIALAVSVQTGYLLYIFPS